VEVELDRVDQLFQAPEFDYHDTHPRVMGGLDEAYDEVRAGHHRNPVTLTVRLPPDTLADLDQDDLRSGISTYCLLRADEVDHETAALSRDGWSSLPIGVAILFVGLVVSQAVNHANLPEELDTFLADGVFLVIAWVGFWYPLDTLLYTRRAADRRADAWRDLADADITFAPWQT
jgi:hypothetical protein